MLDHDEKDSFYLDLRSWILTRLRISSFNLAMVVSHISIIVFMVSLADIDIEVAVTVGLEVGVERQYSQRAVMKLCS